MIKYKSFKLPGNAKLRVRADKIVATVSSKDKNTVDLYLSGVATPFHVPVNEEIKPRDIMDVIWERNETIDDNGD